MKPDSRIRPRLSPAFVVASIALAVSLGGTGYAAAFAASLRTTARAACKPGVTTINGVSARVFCGPARASVSVNGKAYAFKNGQCTTSPVGFVVNVGTVTLGASGKKKPPYFGLLVDNASKDGTYTKGLLTITGFGLDVALKENLKVTLKNGLHVGTLTANRKGVKAFGIVRPGIKVSGSFTC